VSTRDVPAFKPGDLLWIAYEVQQERTHESTLEIEDRGTYHPVKPLLDKNGLHIIEFLPTKRKTAKP